MMRYARSRELLGEDFRSVENAKIVLFGVGGVGSLTLDCLYRTGVSDITIVDFDTYDESNQNRQLGSDGHVGEVKVTRLHARYPSITPIQAKVDVAFVEDFDFSPYDVVIDAIDDMRAKVAIAKKCSEKLISSTGSAMKCDPTKIEVASIWKTHGDKLAKKFRYELKQAGFSGDFATVFSDEPLRSNKGSYMAVTGSFGLCLCAEVIKKLCYNKEAKG